MIETEVKFHGKSVKAHEIGRFLVTVCCGTGEDVKYEVLHKPSMCSILCGLTHDEAVSIADTFSTYAKEDPTATNRKDALGQIGSDVLWWARTHGYGHQIGFAEFGCAIGRARQVKLTAVLRPGR